MPFLEAIDLLSDDGLLLCILFQFLLLGFDHNFRDNDLLGGVLDVCLNLLD